MALPLIEWVNFKHLRWVAGWRKEIPRGAPPDRVVHTHIWGDQGWCECDPTFCSACSDQTPYWIWL